MAVHPMDDIPVRRLKFKLDEEARKYFEDALATRDKKIQIAFTAGYETFTFLGGMIVLDSSPTQPDFSPRMRCATTRLSSAPLRSTSIKPSTQSTNGIDAGWCSMRFGTSFARRSKGTRPWFVPRGSIEGRFVR